ncbi:hypothetical protein JCM16303_004592 [Sporobolomyces ruberrimus]
MTASPPDVAQGEEGATPHALVPSESAQTEDPGDDSSLTSLSDLEENSSQSVEPKVASPTTFPTEQNDQEPQTRSQASPDDGEVIGEQQGSQSQRATEDPPSQGESGRELLPNVPLAPTPTLDSLLQRRELELAVAVQQATNNYALQESSIKLVQSAIESLPTGEQQSMASLMMNRYSSFCTSIDVPLFPLASVKVSFFLAQVLGVNWSDTSIHPNKLPLPTVGIYDSGLTPEEGTRLTRELAEAWVQALGFAQMATAQVWDKVSQSSTSAAPLINDETILEILRALPSIRDWQEWEARRREPETDDRSKTATRWMKQGRPVDPPIRSAQTPTSEPATPSVATEDTASTTSVMPFPMPGSLS